VDEALALSRRNRAHAAGMPACDGTSAAALLPDSALHGLAVAPPNDGFIVTDARYVGAVRDASDPWLDPIWLGDDR
jgi:hypothetical protein